VTKRGRAAAVHVGTLRGGPYESKKLSKGKGGRSLKKLATKKTQGELGLRCKGTRPDWRSALAMVGVGGPSSYQKDETLSQTGEIFI